jgi:hypothetical protein
LFSKGSYTFILSNCEFEENFADKGAAIFFSSITPKGFNPNENKFADNFAASYGNDWASKPFRLFLTNDSINAENFNNKTILSNIVKKIIKPGIQFKLDFEVWLSDRFMQPAFGNR